MQASVADAQAEVEDLKGELGHMREAFARFGSRRSSFSVALLTEFHGSIVLPGVFRPCFAQWWT